MEICSEKCAQNQFHLLECDFLASAKLEKWEFPELRTPLRFLGMKEKDPKKYTQLRSLVSNTNVKVSCQRNKYLLVFCGLLNKFNEFRKQLDMHPIFLKMYHFMSSLETWDVVILVLIILKTHVWLRDF